MYKLGFICAKFVQFRDLASIVELIKPKILKSYIVLPINKGINNVYSQIILPDKIVSQSMYMTSSRQRQYRWTLISAVRFPCHTLDADVTINTRLQVKSVYTS